MNIEGPPLGDKTEEGLVANSSSYGSLISRRIRTVFLAVATLIGLFVVCGGGLYIWAFVGGASIVETSIENISNNKSYLLDFLTAANFSMPLSTQNVSFELKSDINNGDPLNLKAQGTLTETISSPNLNAQYNVAEYRTVNKTFYIHFNSSSALAAQYSMNTGDSDQWYSLSQDEAITLQHYFATSTVASSTGGSITNTSIAHDLMASGLLSISGPPRIVNTSQGLALEYMGQVNKEALETFLQRYQSAAAVVLNTDISQMFKMLTFGPLRIRVGFVAHQLQSIEIPITYDGPSSINSSIGSQPITSIHATTTIAISNVGERVDIEQPTTATDLYPLIQPIFEARRLKAVYQNNWSDWQWYPLGTTFPSQPGIPTNYYIPYRNDKGVVYYWQGDGAVIKRMSYADLRSFQFAYSQKAGVALNWAKDTNHVYWKYSTLAGADPKTFVPIFDANGELTFFGKDQNNVYYQNSLVLHADPGTFTVPESNPSPYNTSTIGHDAYSTYVGTGALTPQSKFGSTGVPQNTYLRPVISSSVYQGKLIENPLSIYIQLTPQYINVTNKDSIPYSDCKLSINVPGEQGMNNEEYDASQLIPFAPQKITPVAYDILINAQGKPFDPSQQAVNNMVLECFRSINPRYWEGYTQ